VSPLCSSVTLEPPDLGRAAASGQQVAALPPRPDEPWLLWLLTLFPEHVGSLPAAHHALFWRWLWSIPETTRPRPFVAVWPRGGAKSTSAELGAVALGALGRRRYGLYVCETQDQADDHVGNIGDMLESARVEALYPALADRELGKYGSSKGWRRNRLRTAADFTVDAVGLDSGARGVKLEDARPDFLVVDDVDGEHDTEQRTAKKAATLTRKLIPAGARNLAVVAIQNLVHADSLFAQLVDGRADWLADRIVSGPIPAIGDLQVVKDAAREVTDGAGRRRAARHVITGGRPTWQGQDLRVCQEMLDDMGLAAFLTECQQEPIRFDGDYWTPDDVEVVTPLRSYGNSILMVDPAVTKKAESDYYGFAVVSRGPDNARFRVYVRYADHARCSGKEARERVLGILARHPDVSVVRVETNQGGELWRDVFHGLPAKYREKHQDEAKHVRVARAHGFYQRGWVVHTGEFPAATREMFSYPRAANDDVVDAVSSGVLYFLDRDARGLRRRRSTTSGSYLPGG
jgi:phage terminase large subunit-like protein